MIKVLVVASDKGGNFTAFVEEQIVAFQQVGCEVIRYGVTRKGLLGYLRELPGLKAKIHACQPDVIHAHFGLCGLLANLQRKVPVVTTFHGCDINNPKIRKYSYPALFLSRYNIFVSCDQVHKVAKPNATTICGTPYQVLPCGVDTGLFRKLGTGDRIQDTGNREQGMGKRILFGSNFERPEKNAALAKAAVEILKSQTGWTVELLPLQGYTREQVAQVINESDCGLMTSLREGSPQFTKEVLACRKPIVSTRVGDVAEQFAGVTGAYIAESTAEDVAAKLETAIMQKESIVPEEWTNRYDNGAIARKLVDIYKQVIR